MSRQCHENQVISELYGNNVVKEGIAGMSGGADGPREMPSPRPRTGSAMPVDSLEANDVTVRLLGSQLMIETHYGSLVVPLVANQVHALREDWSDLGKQDKSA